MSSLHAIIIDPADPKRFVFEKVEAPIPKPFEAVIRVNAISLNLGEVRKAYRGNERIRGGWDLSGIVVQQAIDGSGPKAGEYVVGLIPGGSWCEEVCVPTANLAIIPGEEYLSRAATLPVAGLTALHAVERGTGLLGRRVLVTGASGGVGLFACQLARISGAEVVGYIRQDAYRKIVNDSGVNQVIVSNEPTETRISAPYRLVIDTVGGAVLAEVMTMLAPDGVCVALANPGEEPATFDFWKFAWAGRASLYGLVIFNEFQREAASQGLERLVALLVKGSLAPHVAIEADWNEIAWVADQLWQRKVPGKAVLRVN